MMRYSTRIHIGTMVVIFSIGVILGANGVASAQSVCSEDIAKFCKDNQANKADMMYCLESHENELSASCKKHITKISDMREKAKEYPPVCKDDVSRLCKNVLPGKGDILKCLKEHENVLSAPCKEHTIDASERAEKAKIFHEACGGDAAKLCRDSRFKRLGVVKCLEQNADKLSDSCKELIEKEKKDKEGEKRQ